MIGLVRSRLQSVICVLLLGFGLSLCAQATIDIYEFDNELLRQRYQSFIEEMRCPKCQNQNLAGSDSPIASDLRRELRRLLEEGRSDKEIVDFMVSRYGEYVLYRPRVSSNTLVLWGLPVFLLVAGLTVVVVTIRLRKRNRPQEGEPLIEQQRLDKLLQEAEERDKA